MKRRVTWIAVLAVAACAMTGCSKFSPEETAVSVGKDGKITAAVIEQLDQDYYNEDELKTSIDQAVADFAEENGEDLVTVEKYETEDRKVTLFMDYADADAYAAFNNVVFFTGDMVEAGGAGYDFGTEFQEVKKGEVTKEQVASDEVLSSYNYNVVILQEEMGVEVPGDIVYVSSNVEVTGKKSAKVTGSHQTEEQTESETETEAQAQTDLVSIAPQGEEDTEEETESETEPSQEIPIAYIIYE